MLVEGWVVRESEKCDFLETNHGKDIHDSIMDGVHWIPDVRHKVKAEL
jgi:hypothetical protein